MYCGINVNYWADLKKPIWKVRLQLNSAWPQTSLFFFRFTLNKWKQRPTLFFKSSWEINGVMEPPPSINPSSVLPAHNLFLTTKTWRNEFLDGHPLCTGADSLLRLLMLWGFGSPPAVEIESLYAPVCVTRWTSWSNSPGCLLLKTQNWKLHLRSIRMRSGPCQTQRWWTPLLTTAMRSVSCFNEPLVTILQRFGSVLLSLIKRPL